MDPDQTLDDLREAAQRARKYIAIGGFDYAAEKIVDELTNSFDALDDWLSRGGFMPNDWNPANKRF